METHEEIDDKPTKNYAKVKSEFEKKKLKRILLNYIIFSIKILTYRKNAFSKILHMFRDIEKKHNV